MRRRRLDQLVAAEAVARTVRQRGGGTLLDAGVRVGDLVGPAWRVTTLGAGDVRDLPFAAGAFDAVACLDGLGELPWRERPRALHELARVARRCVVVAAPAPVAALDIVVPLRAWGIVHRRAFGAAAPAGWLSSPLSLPAAALLGAGLRGGRPRARALAARLTPAYRTLVVAEIAASISASSSSASAA